MHRQKNKKNDLLLLLFQMHVAELLVSHGASLNAKTFLDETPIGIFISQHPLINKPGGGLEGKCLISAGPHFQLVQSKRVLHQGLFPTRS